MTKRIRPTIDTSRRRRRRLFTPKNLLKAPVLLAVLIAALLAASPVAAVNITFENCLTEGKQASDDLQWVPLWADASVHKTGKLWRVIYTVFGDVTGQQDKSHPLPAPDNEYWRDNDIKNGKIADTTDGKFGTTVLGRFDSLTYELANDTVSFCREALLGNFSCPLAPRFRKLTSYVSLLAIHARIDLLLIHCWQKRFESIRFPFVQLHPRF